MGKIFCLLFLTAILFAGGQEDSALQEPNETVVIKILLGRGAGPNYDRVFIEEFNTSQKRIRIETVDAPASATDLYVLILQMFESQQNTVDLIPIDTIWPGDFAEHLLDLNTLGGAEIAEQMFAGLVDNNILDGRLLAMPSANTAGILVYRKDLLEKYGYSEPPHTWDELEDMATVIQQGERVENSDFWGYVWQGQAYEGLVCNFLEWTYSDSEDVWINKSRQITVNSPQNVAFLERAKNWIGGISPAAVLTFKEEESRAVFQSGNAAFMRNWFYSYGLANVDESPLKGLVGVTSVPAGNSGHGAATTGAWSMGISSYSEHPEEAFEALKFLLSYGHTLRKAEIGDFPPYTAAYEDKAVLEKYPNLNLLAPVFANSVARPSTITAPNYNAISTLISRGVHDILSGRSPTRDKLEELALDIQDLTNFEIIN